MIWNEQPTKTIQLFFEQLETTDRKNWSWWAWSVPFLIISGPRFTGKKETVLASIEGLLWAYQNQDFLALFDCSEIIGKKHTIKVSVKDKDQVIEDDGKTYSNLWAREITQRLSRSGASGRRIVFLENIERMTTHAANALLKSLEEPLPWRLIVATTDNYNNLLDTIISRGMIIRFWHVPFQTIDAYAQEEFWHVAPSLRRFAVAYSAWRPWLLTKILTQDESIHEMSVCFNACVDFYKEWWSLVKHYKRLQQWTKEYGTLENLLDGLLFVFEDTNHALTQLLIWVKKMMQHPVNEDALLFHLSLDFHNLDDSLT